MKITILYHPVSEHGRKVEEFAREFEQRHPGNEVNLASLETPEGAQMAKLYDIVRYPAVLALRDSGELLKNWQEDQLPLMNELASYIH